MLDQVSFNGDSINEISFTISPTTTSGSIFLKHISVYGGTCPRRQQLSVYGVGNPDDTNTYDPIAIIDIPLDEQGGVIPFTLHFTQIYPNIVLISSANIEVGVRYDDVVYVD